MPTRPKNAAVRSREYLTPGEVDRLARAASSVGRHGHRDMCLIRLAAQHGFRVSELVGLRRDAIDLDNGLIHCARSKNGIPSTHPLGGREVRDLRKLLRSVPEASRFVFVSERGGPLTRSTVSKLVARAGELAGLGFPVHPHQLRHAAGFRLANQGRDTRSIQLWLGHRNIQHTVLYTQLGAGVFEGWAD
jgi:integrase